MLADWQKDDQKEPEMTLKELEESTFLMIRYRANAGVYQSAADFRKSLKIGKGTSGTSRPSFSVNSLNISGPKEKKKDEDNEPDSDEGDSEDDHDMNMDLDWYTEFKVYRMDHIDAEAPLAFIPKHKGDKIFKNEHLLS